MPTASRTFRIFVSSTFSDLKAERDALQKYVFPRLRDLAIAHGCRFQAIDLRWGVSQEAALDQQTMKICLAEIERCQKMTPRPNFVILLGDRYGWRPLPYVIPSVEFEAILPLTTPEIRYRLEWLEEQPEGEKGWYRRDDNAVPPEYILQPRLRGTRFEDYDTWDNEVERPLVAALEQAAVAAGIEGDALVKYSCSATEQEIVHGALGVADAQEHVFAFLRTIEKHEALKNYESTEFFDADPQFGERQQALKARLRERLPGNIHEHHARWDGMVSTDHIGSLPETLEACLELTKSGQAPHSLCQAVWMRLSQVMLAQVAQVETLDALQREVEAHAEFGKQRSDFFTGRSEILQKITGYLANSATRPLGISGESGAGKSALIAYAVKRAEALNQRGLVIIRRFIGATPDSISIRAVLDSLCHELTRAYGGDEKTIPVTYPDLVREFPKRLALASSVRPAWLFLDALDQLSPVDNAHLLGWLPSELPANVKIIVSTLPGECQRLLERLGAINLRLTGLQAQEGAALLDEWLRAARRLLSDEQRSDLLAKFNAGGGLPLYLKLAFEEARRWYSYDGLPAISDHEPGLSGDIPGVIGDLFFRLSQESQHGKILVGRALGYLTVSKNGLTEDELLEVLWLDDAMREDFFRRSSKFSQDVHAIPVVVWARLFMDLEPYLTERSADGTRTLVFYHRQLGEVIQNKFLSEMERIERHRLLAEYFTDQPLDRGGHGIEVYNLRKLSELAYQYAGGQLWGDLKVILFDFGFLQAKTKSYGVQSLIEDYDLFQGNDPKVARLQQVLRQATYVLNEYPHQLATQLWGRLCDTPEDEFQHLLKQACVMQVGPWLRPTSPSLAEPGLQVRRYMGYGGRTLAITPDGKQVISASSYKSFVLLDLATGMRLRSFDGDSAVNAVAVTPDGKQVISASEDHTLSLWDLATGACLQKFVGHFESVIAVVVTPDGRQAISASEDKTLILWELETGKLLRTFQGHTNYVLSVAITPNGEQIISASADQTIILWELATGAIIRNFQGHTEYVLSVSVTPDGKQVLSGSFDKSLILWDLATGAKLRTFIGHTSSIEAVVIVPDGKQAISASRDKTMILWELATGARLRTFEGHTNWITSLVITPNGRQAISSSEGVLILWDLVNRMRLRLLEGHTDWVSAVTITPNGRQVISASRDKTLILWDLGSGDRLKVFEGHTRGVRSVAVTPNGKQIVSASTDNTLVLWDFEAGVRVHTFEGHTHEVMAVAITQDGKQVISASWDRTLILWDLATGTPIRIFEGHSGGICALALSPDGMYVVSASADKTLILWSLTTGEQVRKFEGHKEVVRSVSITPDGKHVISASWDNTLILWDLVTGVRIRTFEGHSSGVMSVAVTQDGKRAISASWDKTLILWDLEDGELLQRFEGNSASILSVALTPDGKQAVSASWDNTLALWEMPTETRRCSFQVHTEGIVSVAVTPTGNQAVVSYGDYSNGTFSLWDLATRDRIRTFSGHSQGVRSVAVTPDGMQVLSASYDKTLILWNLSTGKQIRTFSGHTNWVSGVEIMSDGKQAISFSFVDRTIILWDLLTGDELQRLDGLKGNSYWETMTPAEKATASIELENYLNRYTNNIPGAEYDTQSNKMRFPEKIPGNWVSISKPWWYEGHTDWILAIALTQDGKQVVSASKDGTLILWDLATGRHLRNFAMFEKGDVNTITLTPDGKHIISASGNILYLWDLASGRYLGEVARHTGSISAVKITPDGKHAISILSGGILILWELATGTRLATFIADGPLNDCDITPDGLVVVCGGATGRLHVLNMEGIQLTNITTGDKKS